MTVWYERLGLFWGWIDDHQIDRHLTSAFILWISWRVTVWAMGFAESHPSDGATTLAAVTGPWFLAQAAALKFILESRDKT